MTIPAQPTNSNTSGSGAPRSAFPDGFVWGAATAAYQIEGGATEDGRTASIWDTFSHTPGAVENGDTGDIAADHYHRMPADVALMKDLGLQSYRFSTSWSRILPGGGTRVNAAGLDFYSRLVDELLAAGISPLLTLYHWDLPQELQDAGGWNNRDTAERFADYATVVGRALGDRVPAFTTLNEPWCSAYLGHSLGTHAPGLHDDALALDAAHHLLLAHGRGVAALRAVLPAAARVSITLNLAVVRPDSDSGEDRAAAVLADGLANRIFLEPIVHGRYPGDVQAATAQITDWSFVHDGDLDVIRAPLDVLGVNFYSPTRVAALTPEREAEINRGGGDVHGGDRPSRYPGSDRIVVMPQEGPYTAMGWRMEPASLTTLLLRLRDDYPGLPLMITENGAAFDDEVSADGSVHDVRRIDYLSEHIGAVGSAIRQGADVRGYYVWSLMDNFEWAFGYSRRFGIVYVDYPTQDRTWKDSAYWYRALIAENGLGTG